MNPANGFGRGGHRRGFVLAAMAAALLLLVVAVAVHMRLSGSAEDETSAGASAAGRGRDQPAPAGGTAAPAGQEVLLADGDVSWGRSCGVDLPESDRYGPHASDGDRRYGFTRDAGGAVVAAAHLLVQVSPQVGPDVFVPTISGQVTGPDAQALTDAVHTEYEQATQAANVPYGEPLCPIYARLVGYLVDSHTPQSASLRMLAEGPGPDGAPQRVALLVQLSWADGDWRLVAPPQGDWSRVSTLLAPSATETFIPLGPGE